MERIGLFGGSFDPVHTGHLLVALAAREELGLSKVFFIPAAQSPFKPDRRPVSGEQRASMLRLALAGWNWCAVDSQETDRGGVSYTVDTLAAYRRRFPEAQLFYLIGGDNVAKLPEWRSAEELASLAEFVVIPRPGERLVSDFPKPFRGRTLKGWPTGISSSQIRDRVKAGLPIEHLTPPGIGEFIRNNGLYL